MKNVAANPKNWKLKRKVRKDGSVEFCDYDRPYVWEDERLEEYDNFVFDATLVPNTYYRGRSAAGFSFKDAETGEEFVMRISKTEELLKAVVSGRVKVENGGFTGRFTFFKQGANYTLGLSE